jgi:hypothetical protein
MPQKQQKHPCFHFFWGLTRGIKYCTIMEMLPETFPERLQAQLKGNASEILEVPIDGSKTNILYRNDNRDLF